MEKKSDDKENMDSVSLNHDFKNFDQSDETNRQVNLKDAADNNNDDELVMLAWK